MLHNTCVNKIYNIYLHTHTLNIYTFFHLQNQFLNIYQHTRNKWVKTEGVRVKTEECKSNSTTKLEPQLPSFTLLPEANFHYTLKILLVSHSMHVSF